MSSVVPLQTWLSCGSNVSEVDYLLDHPFFLENVFGGEAKSV